MAVLAPIPRASDSTAAVVKTGLRRNARAPRSRSFHTTPLCRSGSCAATLGAAGSKRRSSTDDVCGPPPVVAKDLPIFLLRPNHGPIGKRATGRETGFPSIGRRPQAGPFSEMPLHDQWPPSWCNSFRVPDRPGRNVHDDGLPPMARHRTHLDLL